ncbi:hypothetical protein D3C72_445700 [compost metagenome]
MARGRWGVWAVVWLAGAWGCQSPLGHPTGDRPSAERLSLIETASDRFYDAVVSVSLTHAQRQVQALPASWSTASLHMANPSALTQPRQRNLTKNVDLVANGSGGYAATNALGGGLRPRAGYTFTVSLWNGAAGTTLVGESQASLNLVGGTNAVTMPITLVPPIALNTVSPGSGIPGDTVTLSGQGFSLLPMWNTVSLGAQTVTPTAASPTGFTVTLPDVGPDTYTWQVKTGTSVATKAGFTVLATIGSPTGWQPATANQIDPAIAYGAGEYMVAWVDTRGGRQDVYVQRLSAGGARLGSETNLTSALPNVARVKPHLAYGAQAGQYLVVWDEVGDILGQRVNADATPAGGAIVVSAASGAQSIPRVRYNRAKQEFLAVYTDTGNVSATRIQADGTTLGPYAVNALAGTQTNAVAQPNADGSKYLVVYDDDSAAKARVLGQFLTWDGTLSGSAFTISNNAAAAQAKPTIGLDTTTGDYLVAWHATEAVHKILGRQVTAAGAMPGAVFTFTSSTGPKGQPRLAYQPWRQKFVVVWSERASGVDSIYGQHIGSDLSLWGSRFSVALGPSDQFVPEVATDTANQRSVCVYQEYNGTNQFIYGQRLR